MPYPEPQLHTTDLPFCDGGLFVSYYDLGNVMYLHDDEVLVAPMNADGTPCGPDEAWSIGDCEYEGSADVVNTEMARRLLLGALPETPSGQLYKALSDRLERIGRRQALAQISFGEKWRDVILGDDVVHGVATGFLRPSHNVTTPQGMTLSKTVLLASVLTDTPVVSTENEDELWEFDVLLVPRRKARGTRGTLYQGLRHDQLMTRGFDFDAMNEPDYDLAGSTTLPSRPTTPA